MKWLITSVLIALVALAGCGQQTVQTPSTDSQVSSFEQDIADVDSLDKDLDTSELDSLDQDFAALQ